MIHEFNQQIYPFTLWVTITNNLTDVKEKFLEYPQLCEFDTEVPNQVNCFVQRVCERTTRDFGLIVVFRTIKDCTTGCIAHEASHVADRVWKYIGERKRGKEAQAYLIQWVVNCIEKVKLNKV